MKVRSMIRRHLSEGTEALSAFGPLTLQRVYIQETVNFCVRFVAGTLVRLRPRRARA
jgi:hypothetical protein